MEKAVRLCLFEELVGYSSRLIDSSTDLGRAGERAEGKTPRLLPIPIEFGRSTDQLGCGEDRVNMIVPLIRKTRAAAVWR